MMFAHSIYSFFTLTQITDAPPVVDEDPLNLDPDYDPNEASDETSDEPVKSTPAKSTPAKSTPAKSTPAKSTPAKSTPAKSTPAKSTPAKSTAKSRTQKRSAWSVDMFKWVKPKTKHFCSKDVIRMAMGGEIELICKIAKVMDIAALYDNDISVYRDNMPSWQSRGHARGLLGWGEKRVKGRTVVKKGALPELNRSCVMKAIEKYMFCVGIPPVIAGTHDMHPRHAPTTCTHDMHPRHVPTTCTQNMTHRSDGKESCPIRV